VTREILFAGFGGQGILFCGKVAAYAGLVSGLEVSWLPSYGPEMRGGTANCHVILSDKPVGSPIVNNPTDRVVMNLPSFDKFEKTVAKGGNIIIDSSLIGKKSEREDINVHYIPATQMANDMGLGKLANMIMLGKMISVTKIISFEQVKKGIEKSVPPSKKDLIESNIRAFEAGYNY
jgi:2-oxoglutarate ferredoxin oxidoreductase subunit gamma